MGTKIIDFCQVTSLSLSERLRHPQAIVAEDGEVPIILVCRDRHNGLPLFKSRLDVLATTRHLTEADIVAHHILDFQFAQLLLGISTSNTFHLIDSQMHSAIGPMLSTQVDIDLLLLILLFVATLDDLCIQREKAIIELGDLF